MPDPKPVAAIVTEYRRHSHADVIVGKILEGPNYDGKDRFGLRVVTMYVDQFPDKDMSRALAEKHGFRLCKTIDEALTLGGDKVAVDGVLNIGEHGTYPDNEKGQKLYPRRRFFEEVTKTFARVKRSVPVFNDKHLAATWDDAKWMYDQSRELYVPFMAGSSVPVTWRKPDLALRETPRPPSGRPGLRPFEGTGSTRSKACSVWSSGRRGRGRREAVRPLSGDRDVELATGASSQKELLEGAPGPRPREGRLPGADRETKDAGVWLIEYLDGFKAAVAILNGSSRARDGGAFCFAGRVKGEDKPRSCQFYLQQPDPFAHFAEQVKAIESLIQTGHAPYPVERTLLTTGVLDAIMTSHAEGGKRIETPHLKIAYQPTDWPHATGPIPMPIKR